ncbi:MAG: bifunctional isocitrate dehydrogenase kinase/phosphatase [Planctomycetota bacterium]
MVPETEQPLALECAAHLRAAFVAYNDAFREITRRAKARFERRQWAEGRRDSVERIDLYDRCVARSVREVEQLLGCDLHDRALWGRAKAVFVELIRDLPDPEFARTYYSSVTRRIFQTVGIDGAVEFVGDENVPMVNVDEPVAYRNYVNEGCLDVVLHRVLSNLEWSIDYEDLDSSAARVATELAEHYRNEQDGDSVLCIDVMAAVFYRDTRAYVLGRVMGWTRTTPLVIVLKNTDQGIAIDAVLQGDGGVAHLFGFARSYFHVDLESVGAAIVFLKRLMPRRPVNELFTVLGRAKQGKTERYRNFATHLRRSRDRFIFAPGNKGMVMVVFTLPSFDLVFKVIRDRFAPPKQTTRDDVMARYDLVFKHDKAGRLVDTQEFRMLKFHRDRFSPDVLEELLAATANTTRLEGDHVVIGHAYLERRLRPLNLYLQEVSAESARRAVVDYGAAIRDLATSNIFPGDLLPKNFGVSYHGRVIFYDYDELCLLGDCNFRRLPAPRTHEDEMSAEPWFYVGEHDVFPEEFGAFLGLNPEQKQLFLDHHGDLLVPETWQAIQARIRDGEILDVLPY